MFARLRGQDDERESEKERGETVRSFRVIPSIL
jgi:hypothetical protein